MSLATSYNVTSVQGARENLENLLKTVEPTETPLFSFLPQSAAPKATLNEWLVDSLADPSISGQIDGVDYTLSDMSDLVNSRARLSNRIQTLQDKFSVSRQAEMVDVAPNGQNGLYNASKAKSLIQLKRSIETAIGSSTDQAAGTSSAGSLLCGLGKWSDPAATGATFDTSLKQGFRAVSGSRVDFASLTESTLRGLLQSVYEASGAKGEYKLFASPGIMNLVTDFTRAAISNNPVYSFTQDVSGKTLIRSVLSFVSDFGSIDIIPMLHGGRGISQDITAATNANPVVVTCNGHGYSDGDKVTISGVLGNTAANGTHTVAGKTANTFQLSGVTGNGSYTSGGKLTAGTDTAEGVINSNRAYLIPDDDTVSLKFLEGITVNDLPDNGAGRRAISETMLTLRVANPRALGSIV
tara:strand:- start:208 stop:1440 length:1233 start_codon:yes stop_codon:yes gene_type:complete